MESAARIILHVDMDAFYAAVETLDRPELAHRPVVIGAQPRGGKGRGVVSTANYAARKYGIHSAMPISQAWRRCPHAVFLSPSFAKYQDASRSVMEVLASYADSLQIVGMDEAYLDVTEACGSWGQAASFCRSLRAAVTRATGLSCSIGAAVNKSTAKIASDFEKPRGITIVAPGTTRDFLAPLPVRLINGCGPKTSATLAEWGYHTIKDLAEADPAFLESRFGSHGRWLHDLACGRDARPVMAHRGAAKSRGNERTFGRDESGPEAVLAAAGNLIERLVQPDKASRPFATLTVKLRYHDFTTLTRSYTFPVPVDAGAAEDRQRAMDATAVLLRPLLEDVGRGQSVRLVGVRISNFSEPTGQRTLSLFGIRAPPGMTRPRRPTPSGLHVVGQQTLTPAPWAAFVGTA